MISQRTFLKRSVALGVVIVAIATFLVPSPALASAPGAPTALVAAPGDTQVDLSWTAPVVTGGGGGITDYLVDYSSDAGVTYIRLIDSVSVATTATVPSLINGTTYKFRVSAVNGADVGATSTEVVATPNSNHTPNDPATYSACPTGVIPSAAFSDTTLASVNCIKYYGITLGTTTTTYSPFDTVTRWQMALFLTRLATTAAITLPDGSAQGFLDISGESAEIQTAINQIKQLGITVGKTATTYAPAGNVTREEMALFIDRLLRKATVGPGGNSEYVSGSSGATEIKSNDTDFNFTDMPVGLLESRNAIINLWNLGITDVQTVATYEPSVVMNRRAMAIFMANALAHTNARPAGLVIQASTYRVAGSPPVYFSVSHRTADFAPIADSAVDTFKYTHSGVTGNARFNASGYCQDTLVTTIGNTKCSLDPSDPKTDASGNLAVFFETIPTMSKVDVWAWTTSPTTIYDNDLHASDASMVTVETHM